MLTSPIIRALKTVMVSIEMTSMLNFLHANYPSHTRKNGRQEERTKIRKTGETPDLQTAAERVGRLINTYLAHEGRQTPNGE